MNEQEIEIGTVEDYFSHQAVASFTVKGQAIHIGDILHFKGHTTDVLLEAASMEIDHKPVKSADVGDMVGVKVNERIRIHDRVFKVIPAE